MVNGGDVNISQEVRLVWLKLRWWEYDASSGQEDTRAILYCSNEMESKILEWFKR